MTLLLPLGALAASGGVVPQAGVENAAANIDDLQVPEEEDHGPGHGNEAGMPQFNLDTFPSQIFWLAVMFTIMYLYFSKKLLPSIAYTIENREQHIRNDLMEAENLTQEAEQTQKQYEQRLTEARAEASAAYAAIEADMKEKAEKMRAEFAKDAEAKINETKARIEEETLQAKQEIQEQITSISALASEELAGIQTSPKEVQSVINSMDDNTKNKKAKAA